MADRRLVITEADPAAPDYGKLLALAPNTASSVPIPAFTFGPTKPAVGSLLGEGFYEINTRRGWVWDGAAWLEIAASPVVSYATEAALLADTTKPSGVFGIAASTGAMYAKTTTGWRYVGIKEYATTAALLADAPSAGALGIADDDSSLWERTSTGWRCLTIRELADTAAVVAWAGTADCHNGDRAIDLLHGVVYIRTATGWHPTGYWEDTEANIRAATWPLNGQEAISTDSGRTFVRVAGAWVESPINHYPTQTALLAAKPTGAQMAWADDTGNVFTYSPTSKTWVGLNTGFDDPLPIGAIADFPTRAVPNGWLECDGSAIPADAKFNALRTLLGTANLPDLRGLFSRAAKTGETLLTKVDWTTGMPKTPFTATTEAAGAHNHVAATNSVITGWSGNSPIHFFTNGATPSGVGTDGAKNTGWELAHTHRITMAGGDAETAPDYARLVRCIKAFHITVAKPAPDQLLTALVTPAQGQTLLFDAATGSWKNGSVPTISYSTSQPVAPSLGDLWYNSNNNRKLLNVWNGTEWVGTTGFGIGVAGSAVQLPGYFNQDPSATATPADTGGLSFRYSGGQTQLFLNKGNAWNAMTPMLGNTANYGSVAVADSHGNMAWATEPRFARSSADLGTAGEHLITLERPATRMFEMSGFVMNASDFRAIPRMGVGGATDAEMWNFTSTSSNTRSQALTAYKDGGSHINDGTYFSTHQAGFNYKNETTLAAKGGYPITFTLKATHMAANYWFFDLESKYLSQNNTPLVVTASWMSESLSALGIFRIGVRTCAWNSDTVVPSHHSINCRYL
jgi:microcystin-dependent protein